jgi:hypothetical protein
MLLLKMIARASESPSATPPPAAGQKSTSTYGRTKTSDTPSTITGNGECGRTGDKWRDVGHKRGL